MKSLEISEPSCAVAVTVIDKPVCVASFIFKIPFPSISAMLPPVLILHFTVWLAFSGVTFAFNFKVAPFFFTIVASFSPFPSSVVISIPVAKTASGFSSVVPPISSTTISLSALLVSIVVLSVASTLETVPAPAISVFPLEVEVILSTVASFATSTCAVAEPSNFMLPTFAEPSTFTSAFALPLMATSATFAEPSKAISAVALPLTATVFTSAPSSTVTFASPATSTFAIAASFSNTISASFSAVMFSTLPLATLTGALACTFIVSKPTILAAALAIKLLIDFLVLVTISTKGALVLSLVTVTLPSKEVVPTKVIVHLKLLAAATAVSSPM